MAKAFLHRQEDIGVAAGLDMDDPVGMKAGKTKGRREQIAPAQAPEDRPVEPCENAGEKDGRGCIVAKIRAAGDLVQRAGQQPAARQPAVNFPDAEREPPLGPLTALDSRDSRP